MAKHKKRPERIKHPNRPGSLGGEMRQRVNARTKAKSNYTRRNYLKACAKFDLWRKETGLSNRIVREDPYSAIGQWRDCLQRADYAPSTIHTMIIGVACGLGIDATGLAKSWSVDSKTKSIGLSFRSQQARERPENAEIVRFQEMVGGRRSALQRLTGSDFVQDESGEWCVRFLGDKGGKNQLQRIAPENQAQVRAYFDAVGPDELLFPEPIDRHLDLHGIRAEHAREEYERYAAICSTVDGRRKMREQLWRRYTDPTIGCKAYLEAKKAGEKDAMRTLRMRFSEEMKDGIYYLQRANRRVALERGLPVAYDRLALCCTSVFSLSHWRNEVTIKSYMLK